MISTAAISGLTVHGIETSESVSRSFNVTFLIVVSRGEEYLLYKAEFVNKINELSALKHQYPTNLGSDRDSASHITKVKISELDLSKLNLPS